MLVVKRVAGRESRPLAGTIVAAGSSTTTTTQQQQQQAAHLHAYHTPRYQHQRRHSSSKPSSPPSDGSIAAPASDSTHAKRSSPSTASTATTAATTTGRKRAVTAKTGKAKDNKASSQSQSQAASLPSVPSTQHLDAQAVNLASFFSLHRPISVTYPVPQGATNTAFASIFQPSSQSNSSAAKLSSQRANETLQTLTSAVRMFDKAVQAQESGGSPSADGSPQQGRADDTEGGVIYVSVHELAQSFRPFHPPPPPALPEAVTETEQTVHDAVLSGQRAAGAVAARFAARMRSRRREYMARMAAGQAGVWHAISVRRQRKLKMKKHKFKKLLKRQKNEKRRQDRL